MMTSHSISRRELLAAGAFMAGGFSMPAMAAGEAGFALASRRLAQVPREFVAGRKISGAVVSVGSSSRDAVHHAVGFRSLGGAPIDAETIFRLYCTTKPITALGALKLMEEGRLRMEQPLHDVLPAFREMKVLDADGERAASRPITIRDLFAHTSGITMPILNKDPAAERYLADGLIPSRFSLASVRNRIRSVPSGLADFCSKVAAAPLAADPGSTFIYGLSYDVLGGVVETVSGMPLEAFLRDRILDPLGMVDTRFVVPASDVGRLARNYAVASGTLTPLERDGENVFATQPSFPDAGSGMVSTPRDYARFLRMLLSNGALDGRRICRTETAVLMRTDLLPASLDTGHYGRQGYGCGGFVARAGRDDSQPAGCFGWGGIGGTYFWIDPRRDIFVSLMTQYFPASALPFKARLMDAVYGRGGSAA